MISMQRSAQQAVRSRRPRNGGMLDRVIVSTAAAAEAAD